MANNNKTAQTSSQAPTYVFITGANPDVKLLSFQFGGFDPMTLQFGGIRALPAPAAEESILAEESFPPLASAVTTSGLSSRGKRSIVVIPNPTRALSRKVRNGKAVLEDCTTIYRGQPTAVKMLKTVGNNAASTSHGRVSVFDRLSYSGEVHPTKHQHQKTCEDDFDLKFVTGIVIGSAASKSKSRNSRRRAAKRAKAAASGVHTVNVITHIKSSDQFTIPTNNPFEILEHPESHFRVEKKMPVTQSSNTTGNKKISKAIHQVVQQVKALQHTPLRVFSEKKNAIVNRLMEVVLPRTMLPLSDEQCMLYPASKAGGKSITYESPRTRLVVQAPTKSNQRRAVIALPRATVHTCYMTGSKDDGEAEKRPGVETRSMAHSHEQSTDTSSQAQDSRIGGTGPVIIPQIPNMGVGGTGTIILPPPEGENVLNSPDDIREFIE
jgi:hypothetical protein